MNISSCTNCSSKDNSIIHIMTLPYLRNIGMRLVEPLGQAERVYRNPESKTKEAKIRPLPIHI